MEVGTRVIMKSGYAKGKIGTVIAVDEPVILVNIDDHGGFKSLAINTVIRKVKVV